jgi:hypothetical protein
MKVLLGGEGATELGDWAREPQYRAQPPMPGVIEALLRRAISDADLQVVDGVLWTRIVKYRSGDHRRREKRNVLGLVLKAREAKCDAVVFARDRDGDEDREAEVEAALGEAATLLSAVNVAGGTANEKTEAWLLALLDDRECERHHAPEVVLKDLGFPDVEAKVRIAQGGGDLVKAGSLAASLARWLRRVRLLSGD